MTNARPSGSYPALFLVLAVTAIALGACTARTDAPRSNATEPHLEDNGWVARDGIRLPMTRWLPEGEPRGVVLALHGFSEHREVFYALAPHLAGAGYAVYAYDQRGFGDTAGRGTWPGSHQLVDDARSAYRLLTERHPGRPIHLLGHSMGGAIAALAVTGPEAIAPAGTVLLAPAVYGWSTLPWLYSMALRTSQLIMPNLSPQQSWGRYFVDVTATDDRRVRAIQAYDRRILRAVPINMLYGLVNLMQTALGRMAALPSNVLILYGERDDIIPRHAGCAMLQRMQAVTDAPPRLGLYADGYHYLTRDRQRIRTIADVRSWLIDPTGDLPSQADVSLADGRKRLCS